MAERLYHGGTHVIEVPEIREPERTLDFGRGFYLTSSREQAEQWIRRRLRSPHDSGFVNSYSFQSEEASRKLNIRIFESADEEWVDFVLANRMIKGFTHDFDIVIGPVADDKVYTQFSLFEGGIISKETLLKELKSYRLVDQYLFHTAAALPFLKHLSYYEVKK